MKLLLIAGLFFALPAWAADVKFAHIPLRNGGVPADDLVDPKTGKTLNPEQAQRVPDLLSLDPKEDPKAWLNHPPGPLDAELDKVLPVKPGMDLTYAGRIPSQRGVLRFAVQLPEASWGPTLDSRYLHLMMSVQLHEFLLRTAVLRKLGYQIPAMRYLSEVTVHFASKKEKLDLLERVVDDTRFGESRWMKAETDTTLVLQDVAVMSTSLDEENLQMGIPPGQLTARLKRALAVPYSVAFAGESLNKMDWVSGRVDNGDVLLSHDDGSDFYCTLPDALWGVKRILALSPADWDEVVEFAGYPGPVAKLLRQKLASRRNSLIDLFELRKRKLPGFPLAKFPVDTKVSEEPYLQRGKLVKTDYWPGYASRFAHGDPNNPLEGTPYLMISKAEAVGFQSLFSYVNGKIPQITFEEAVARHSGQVLFNKLSNFFANGEMGHVPIRLWQAPFVGPDIKILREVMTGNFMGTDNAIQLVDTVSLGATVGIRFTLWNTLTPVALSVAPTAGYTRSFSHVKPINGKLKDALKEPLTHLFVPLLLRNAGARLHELSEDDAGKLVLAQKRAEAERRQEIRKAENQLLTAEDLERRGKQLTATGKSGDVTILEAAKLRESLQKLRDSEIKLGDDAAARESRDLLKELKTELHPGDSFIITDTIPGSTAAQLGITVPQSGGLTFNAGGGEQVMLIARTHFYRGRDGKTLYIYRDRGESHGFSFSAGVGEAGIPILDISGSRPAGHAHTEVYKLALDTDVFEPPTLPEDGSPPDVAGTNQARADYGKLARAVAASLLTGFTGRLHDIQRPLIVERDFHDSSTRFSFLFWVWRHLEDDALVRVRNADGDASTYLNLSLGRQKGKHYYKLASDVAEYYLRKISGGQASIDRDTAADPGQSYLGSSKTRNAEYQANTTPGREEPFVLISYDQRGWKISRKNIEKRVAELGQRFHREFFPPEALTDTDAVKFYDLFTEISIYRRGLEQIDVALQGPAFANLLEKYRQSGKGGVAGDLQKSASRLAAARAAVKGDLVGAPARLQDPRVLESRARLQFVSDAERLLDFDDFMALVGGENNLFVRSRLDGFRVRSEKMLDPLPSNTIGRVGSRLTRGPLSQVQFDEGLESGEFGAYFLRERL